MRKWQTHFFVIVRFMFEAQLRGQSVGAQNLKDGHGLPDGTADKANPWALARLPVSLTVCIRHGDVTERESFVTAARPSATSRPTILLNGKSMPVNILFTPWA